MNLGEVIKQIIALAKSDIEKATLPLLAAFFTSIAANPSKANIVAQLAKLEFDLLAVLPTIETDVLKQIAAELNTDAQALLTP